MIGSKQSLWLRTAAAKLLANTFDDSEDPFIGWRAQVRQGIVDLPWILQHFLFQYCTGAFPELMDPTELERRIYELQFELDRRSFDLRRNRYFIARFMAPTRWPVLWWSFVTLVTATELIRLVF